MNQEWFEMGDIRRRKLNSTVWIPLCASRKLICEGQYGYLGYKEEYFSVISVAIPIADKDAAHKLKWDEIGMSYQYSGYYQDGVYCSRKSNHQDSQGYNRPAKRRVGETCPTVCRLCHN